MANRVPETRKTLEQKINANKSELALAA